MDVDMAGTDQLKTEAAGMIPVVLDKTLIEKLTPSHTVCEKGSTAGTGKTATVSVKGLPVHPLPEGVTR
jgi:hypothetical protein